MDWNGVGWTAGESKADGEPGDNCGGRTALIGRQAGGLTGEEGRMR